MLASVSPRMARSPQSRHRKRRLLEATQHVSSSSERQLVESLAVQTSSITYADQTEAVNASVRVLRNVKNSVYLRGDLAVDTVMVCLYITDINRGIVVALAARALGLLMQESRPLADRLRLETEGLVDALLQLVGYCRRSHTQTADTRRVHVNCCLVISLLMQGTRRFR
ncbi:hypothetical protein DVH05_001615 [Phytophthora capsici]|nr:hypothetical protein DVH05_001615 [Phytophthora capsici]